MLVDTGTNEWDGDEGEECDNFEPDYDKDNDDMWLRKKEEVPIKIKKVVVCSSIRPVS